MATKTVYTAVYDTLADWEVGAAIAHIGKPEWQVAPGTFRLRTVGRTRDPIRTMGGVHITPDIALDELTPETSAMLILPGSDLWMSGELSAFESAAREFVAAGVPVAAICGATYGLARAGLLDTRAHTSNAAEFLTYSGYAGGPHYAPEPAVTDGDVITASGVAPIEFAREILRRLGVYEPHILDAWYRLFTDRDPAAYMELDAYERARSVPL
ncbi:type 1 glutamine amidotransferase family protein [Nocardia bovistercoris]|uniref:Glutamine amidotransferase n=1 Tax=Nocardia bovistercoris TaxID=2785916 RepID=A0A931IDJ3_9NOCA|nr:type 1 glutamine amidotransferase family protein [Nocardia bovistercoris]MBH0778142.1 glutamine amidotransferase [Nocardia bovistercoris]